MSDKDFKEVVATHIGYNWATGDYDVGKAWKLAEKFGCMKITVIRWISGRADPPVETKQSIVEYIRTYKTSP